MVKNIDFKSLHVAYFSMEIGLDSDIPTYSGGLGVLAGDTLRSCADMGLPVIGVTLLYKNGYFKQKLDDYGNQREEDVVWDPKSHMRRLTNRISIMIEGREVQISAWLYELEGITGDILPIIFLDTDLPMNSDYDKTITHKLYGYDDRYRLSQEMVLGIGGFKMLESIGCELEKYHMNEGHSALLVLELYKKFKKNAIDEVREKCVFTTHTPVPAGHDQFDIGMAKKILGDYIKPELEGEVFLDGKLNMTYVGLRFSKFVNGVAKKHGEVSRSMFPGYHIESITNGVHSYFWTSPSFRKLFSKYLPGWEFDPFSLRYMLSIPRDEIWEAHLEAKRKLFNFIKKKHNVLLDEEVFTIGFARRAATYKRGDMLFADINRLMKIAENCKGIQIIYSGKAHPNDSAGKDIIRRIIENMKKVSHKIKVCYIENYNLDIAKLLVSGVDVWLNTPLRPKEASGTSGMKAAHNGVPHLSILDGWWIEGHIEKLTGWSIGPEMGDKENETAIDTEDLYNKLEYIIIPKFYKERDDWIKIMQHSIAINGSFFNTHRMVQQYVLNAYFE